jgi:hypothetical protein
MKRNLFFIGMGAMALATPLFLSSCSSSDDIADNTGNTTGEAVKTSFTLSVGMPGGNNSSAKANPATRMGEDVTQAQTTPVFRGMDNMTLIPFAGVSTSVASGATRLGSNINLPNAVANSLTSSQITKTGNAHVYSDVSVPLTTNAFLFYAKAIDGETAGATISSDADKAKYGTLTASGLSESKPESFTFSPVQIAASPTMDKGNAIATYLTNIANATAAGEGGKAWSAVTADGSTGQGKALADLYKAFTGLSAGSSNNIQAAVQDLYTSLLNIKSSQTTENQGVIDGIIAKITDATYASADAGKLTFTETINSYPEDNYLPDGAATVKWENNKFTAQNTSAYTSDAVNVGPMANYVYPANLWYRANTMIRTDDAAHGNLYGSNDNNYTSTSWADILSKYAEDNGSVKVSTRSIALKDPIQYAVGRLDTKVTIATTLYDHAGQAVNVTDGGFPITAILVGNQRVANWEFKPKDASATATQYTVYDKTMPEQMTASTSGSPVNHTLLLETPENQAVNIVVEFENNSGNVFRGHNNELIPAGAKFYMVAQLNPSAGSGVTQPKDGSIKNVILQDYVTKANLSINTNDGKDHDKGLGAAYNVIPDLRTPALSIGLSVDLTWQTGLTFEVDM